MSALQKIADMLPQLSGGEKAQLLQWVAQDLGNFAPGIETSPQVCDGEPCIVWTRVPVWVLERARLQNVSDAEILGCYPTLRAEDLANAWAYVRGHKEEIDRQIQENEAP